MNETISLPMWHGAREPCARCERRTSDRVNATIHFPEGSVSATLPLCDDCTRHLAAYGLFKDKHAA
jgi:hypothetical protein